jgi:ribose transport system permease protein
MPLNKGETEQVKEQRGLATREWRLLRKISDSTSVQRAMRTRNLAFGPQRFPKVVLIGVFGLGIAITIVNSRFISSQNLTNMAQAASLVGIAAIAQTIVLIGGGLDLSIGAMAASSGLVLAKALNAGIAEPIAILLALLFGAALGLCNGILVGILKLNPIIGTLGSASVFYGAVLLYTEGIPVLYPDNALTAFGARPLGISAEFFVYLGTMLVVGFLLHMTVWGWRLYTVGASEPAARNAGIRVTRIQISSYVMSGLLAGIAGGLLDVELGSAQPNGGQSWLLISIAAPIVGGVAVTGGVGTLTGAFLGIVLITEINNGLILAGLTSYSRDLALGSAILLAMATQSDRLKEMIRRAVSQHRFSLPGDQEGERLEGKVDSQHHQSGSESN